jgi:hypothetical protein
MRFQNQDGWLETKENKLYVVSKYKLDIKPELETEYGYFYKVLNAWESFSGWYWFQLAKENEYGYCFGFVQGISASLGPFSPSELNELKPKVWKLKKVNLQYSGVRELPNDWKQPIKKGA